MFEKNYIIQSWLFKVNLRQCTLNCDIIVQQTNLKTHNSPCTIYPGVYGVPDLQARPPSCCSYDPVRGRNVRTLRLEFGRDGRVTMISTCGTSGDATCLWWACIINNDGNAIWFQHSRSPGLKDFQFIVWLASSASGNIKFRRLSRWMDNFLATKSSHNYWAITLVLVSFYRFKSRKRK